jgi:hypothetical protein
MADPQVLMTAVQLVKLQSHGAAIGIKPAEHVTNSDVPVKMR